MRPANTLPESFLQSLLGFSFVRALPSQTLIFNQPSGNPQTVIFMLQASCYGCVFFREFFCHQGCFTMRYKTSLVSQMILYFHYTDLTSNPTLGNHDGFRKNLLEFLKYLQALFHTGVEPHCHTDTIIIRATFTCVKPNHNH